MAWDPHILGTDRAQSWQQRQQVVDEAALTMLLDPDGPDVDGDDVERTFRQAARWSVLRPRLEALRGEIGCVGPILAEVEVVE